MDTSKCFMEGDEVKRIEFADEGSVAVGHYGVEKIEVVMEYGQMAGVPWFAVWVDGRVKYKHNATFVVSVEI